MDAAIVQMGLVEDDTIQLDAAALELAALDHPAVDLEPYVALLTTITEHVAALADEAPTASAQAAVLSAVLTREFGFSGDRDHYDDPDNADLIRVIDRRRGMPISLAILYVAAARRVGWSAEVLNTPGHVLAQIGAPTSPVLIDPFNDGQEMSQAGLSALLAGMLGAGTVPRADHVAAMANRDVLVRLLINQATRAERAGNAARALVLFARMTTIAPSNPHVWWEHARLSLMNGDVAAARASLGAMLETTRDTATRVRIAAALDSLAGTS
ncbi:SirB1 family protein [Sphingomonas sp.]|uniref:SirB1 family protein n=1 Tax=Sphingomonas sp. TaxID=28214 RepID=UPI0035C80539